MACKQGIRKSMDHSREYYRDLKRYDPTRELWVSLVKRSSLDRSLSDWSVPERAYFAVCLLEGEIYNGGLDQYFSNSAADYFCDAVFGLEEMGATRALTLLRSAERLAFGEIATPKTQADRWALMKRSPHTSVNPNWEAIHSTSLEELDRAFYEISDDLSESLANFAEVHGLIKPFELEQ